MPKITRGQASAVKKENTAAPATTPEHTAEEFAMVLLHPACAAAVTINAYPSVPGAVDRSGMGSEMMAQIAAAKNGDLSRGEAILVAQAHALDAMFNHLVQWATKEDYIDNAEVLMRLGLKAQSQCRATIEALDRIKNPRSYAVIHQANLANGPQQVNNRGAFDDPQPGPPENKKSPNELSAERKQIELLPNARTPAPAGRINSTVAAVAKVHRTKNTRG